MAGILIYEPIPKLAQRIHGFLTKEGYEAVLCKAGEIPAKYLQAEEKPLAIIDTKMRWVECRPLLDAFAQCACPVLFVTEDANMADHLKALYAYQNDVLCVPFTKKKMMEQVKALRGEKQSLLHIAIDHQEKAAILAGKRVSLTAQEYALLVALMKTPDIPVSRETLLRTAWGYQCIGDTRTVDVHIQRLRKKIGGEFIETVYRCGYRLKTA